MGLFGNSKKSNDAFQAAVEKHQRRTPTATLRARQSESASRRNADHFHCRRPFPWQEGAHEHPYKQPGFGFYSGENLAAAQPRAQETKRSLSFDDGFGNIHGGPSPGPSREGLPFPPLPMSAGTSCWDGAGHDADCPPWMDHGARADAAPWDSSYQGLPYCAPEEQMLRPNGPLFDLYEPRTRTRPMDSPVTPNGRRFTTRSPPFNTSAAPERLHFDPLHPFRNTHMPNPYTPSQGFRQDAALGRYPSWNGYSGGGGGGGGGDRPFSRATTADQPPPRPPGSYERLRPPHLQRGNSVAGSRNSPWGDARFR